MIFLDPKVVGEYNPANLAQNWLGVTEVFGDELFFEFDCGDTPKKPWPSGPWTPAASDAIAVLRDIDNFTTWQDYYNKNVKGGAE